MSGHSKWATIRHKKGAADAKRGQAFSKLAKLISVAAREGADPAMNFSLRLAIDKAKSVNMPKDNIERAIARGSGEGGEGALETAIYECMGPGGAAVVIVAVTDNTNRAYTNIKTICNKQGANTDAKVLWQFAQKGVVRVEDISTIEDRDMLELALIDAGAEDISWDDEVGLEIICEVPDLKRLSDAVQAQGLPISSASLEYIAQSTVELQGADEEKLMRLIEILEEDDDVDSVFTNAQ